MSFLFDSSAVTNLVKRRRARYLRGFTLSLAFYEIVNAVWKETYLLQRYLHRRFHQVGGAAACRLDGAPPRFELERKL